VQLGPQRRGEKAHPPAQSSEVTSPPAGRAGQRASNPALIAASIRQELSSATALRARSPKVRLQLRRARLSSSHKSGGRVFELHGTRYDLKSNSATAPGICATSDSDDKRQTDDSPSRLQPWARTTWTVGGPGPRRGAALRAKPDTPFPETRGTCRASSDKARGRYAELWKEWALSRA